MSSGYVYDNDDFRFRRQKRSARSVILRILKYFVVSVLLAVLYYAVLSLFFSTEKERELRAANRMYEKLYPEIVEKQRLLDDVISGLETRDNSIYNDLFQTDVIGYDLLSPASDLLLGSDSLSVEDIISYSSERYVKLGGAADNIDSDFMEIFSVLSSEDVAFPPMSLPLSGFSCTSTGASTGNKINPFYKVKVLHEGLDMMAPSGTGVLASADGIVSKVTRSRKGLGNVVEIDHGDGYVTKYAHLSNIRVLRGRRVRKGDIIGNVGMSGNSFASHLHYEVWKDTVALDPVNYFFGSVSPEEYMRMLLLSAGAGQSMD